MTTDGRIQCREGRAERHIRVRLNQPHVASSGFSDSLSLVQGVLSFYCTLGLQCVCVSLSSLPKCRPLPPHSCGHQSLRALKAQMRETAAAILSPQGTRHKDERCSSTLNESERTHTHYCFSLRVLMAQVKVLVSFLPTVITTIHFFIQERREVFSNFDIVIFLFNPQSFSIRPCLSFLQSH